jgi:ubiquitin-protein ligase
MSSNYIKHFSNVLEKKQFTNVKYEINYSKPEIIIKIPSLNPNITFNLKTDEKFSKWIVDIPDKLTVTNELYNYNCHESLSKILPGFNVLDINNTTIATIERSIKNLVELLEILKIHNYCFNCGNALDLGGDKFMACDNLDCINICNSRLLDDSVTSEFQKYKNSPNLSILEFVIKTAYWAVSSPRRNIIYNPKPIYLNITKNVSKDTNKDDIYDWCSIDKFINKYDIDKILQILVKYDNDMDLYNNIGDIGYGFIKFTLKSNNTIIFNGSLIDVSDINKLFVNNCSSENVKEKYIDTIANNLLKIQQFSVQHPQLVENRFKKASKTCYLYHGSRQENWYSIMRNGLKVGSDNKLQVNGAAHGAGIYLSDQVNFSVSYSVNNTFGNQQSIVIGVYQVMDTREKWFKKENIYVVPEDKDVLLQYLLIFPYHNYSNEFQYGLLNLLNTKFQSTIYQDQNTKQSQVSSLRTKRLMKEYRMLIQQDCCKLGFRIELKEEDNLDLWKIYIPSSGFEGNPIIQKDMEKYKIKDVELEFRFNENYPVQPPFVRIVSPRFIYRTGHITLGGSICMELLTNQGWDMTTSISTVVTYIKSAVMEGEGQIDPANYYQSYNMEEAVEAYNRMLKSHGWI